MTGEGLRRRFPCRTVCLELSCADMGPDLVMSLSAGEFVDLVRIGSRLAELGLAAMSHHFETVGGWRTQQQQ